jgi:ribosomal protein S18 acetylase RimI-like enzyme
VEIVRVRADQIPEAAAVLARAFQDDPAWCWVLPSATRRAKALPALFRLGFELIEAEIWVTAGSILGSARWLPPGRPRVHPAAAVRAAIETPVRLREATSRFLAYGRSVDNLRRHAVPVPHWYLAGIGVDPPEQRRGIGGALLAPGVEAAERDGVPCALLTNAEQNLSFYGRHGFVTVLEGETPPGGPHAWMMVRQPAVPALEPLALDSRG